MKPRSACVSLYYKVFRWLQEMPSIEIPSKSSRSPFPNLKFPSPEISAIFRHLKCRKSVIEFASETTCNSDAETPEPKKGALGSLSMEGRKRAEKIPFWSVPISTFFHPFSYLWDPVFVNRETRKGFLRPFPWDPVFIQNWPVFIPFFIPFSIYVRYV